MERIKLFIQKNEGSNHKIEYQVKSIFIQSEIDEMSDYVQGFYHKIYLVISRRKNN